MLSFAQNPDIIFSQILDQAFDHGIDLMIRDHLEQGFDANRWELQLPHASKIFSPETAMDTAKEMRRCHQDKTGLWALNDYHYCLLYDILEEFCEVRNDEGRELEMPFAVFKDSEIWQVDFELLLETYFPDTDFLIPLDRMAELDDEEKKQFGFRPETFPIAMGLKPHPKELQLKLSEKGDFEPHHPSDTVYWRRTDKYPDLRYE